MARPRHFDIAATDDLAHAQGGVVAFNQLVELGMSNATISRWTRTGGPLQRVLPGTYLLHKGTPTLTSGFAPATATRVRPAWSREAWHFSSLRVALLPLPGGRTSESPAGPHESARE